jgi:hypothetical protein
MESKPVTKNQVTKILYGRFNYNENAVTIQKMGRHIEIQFGNVVGRSNMLGQSHEEVIFNALSNAGFNVHYFGANGFLVKN